MPHWEYLQITQGRGFSAPISGAKPSNWDPTLDLAKLGSEGWELVSAIPLSGFHGEDWAGVTGQIIWVFKRPVQ